MVPFTISCGECSFCQKQMFSLCQRSNRNASLAVEAMGHSPAGLFGFSHMLGGYAGGQAEYLRVPYVDVDHVKVPDAMTDEQVLFRSDIFPTGYMAADNCNLQGGETVAVWGCGPVGQFAIRSAFLLGAERVIAIDQVPERLALAQKGGAETIDFSRDKVYDRLQEMTHGRGPDACIDAVGTEPDPGSGIDAALDKAKAALHLGTDRPHVLREAIMACRKGGTLSVLGVYGLMDTFPMGVIMNKGMTMRSAQQHGQAYMDRLLAHVQKGELNPACLATHRFPLEDAPRGYDMFKHKTDGCVRAVFAP